MEISVKLCSEILSHLFVVYFTTLNEAQNIGKIEHNFLFVLQIKRVDYVLGIPKCSNNYVVHTSNLLSIINLLLGSPIVWPLTF